MAEIFIYVYKLIPRSKHLCPSSLKINLHRERFTSKCRKRFQRQFSLWNLSSNMLSLALRSHICWIFRKSWILFQQSRPPPSPPKKIYFAFWAIQSNIFFLKRLGLQKTPTWLGQSHNFSGNLKWRALLKRFERQHFFWIFVVDGSLSAYLDPGWFCDLKRGIMIWGEVTWFSERLHGLRWGYVM